MSQRPSYRNGGTDAPDFTAISEINLDLSRPLVPSNPSTNQDIHPDLIVLTRHPSRQQTNGAGVVVTARATRGSSYQRIAIQLNTAMAWTPVQDEELEISFGTVLLKCGPAMINFKAHVIDSKSREAQRFRLTDDELKAATAYATPVNQKNFYVMMAAVKTADGDGDGAGAADISMNQTFYKSAREVGALFDNAAIKFMTKKSTGTNADPRAQLVGVEFTKALLWRAANRARKGEEFEKTERQNLVQGRGWTRGAVVYEMLQLEGDAYDFNAVNYVSDTQFTVPSIAKRLTSRGFWNFRCWQVPNLGEAAARPRRAPPRRSPASRHRTTFSGRRSVPISPFGGGEPRATRRDLRSSRRRPCDAVPVSRRVCGRGRRPGWQDGAGAGDDRKRNAALDASEHEAVSVWHRHRPIRRSSTYYRGGLPPLFAHANAFQFGMVIDVGSATTSAGELMRHLLAVNVLGLLLPSRSDRRRSQRDRDSGLDRSRDTPRTVVSD